MPGRALKVISVATLVLLGAVEPGAALGARGLREGSPPPSAKRAPAVTLTCSPARYGPADEPAPGVLPAEYDRDGYKLTSRRDPALRRSPQNHCGRKGAAVDLAWGVTKGRDDVLIAVLDSGIRWRSVGAMQDLARKAYINLAEARPPCAAPDGDCNDDGVFDIADFGAITDRNANGLADPEDLILDPLYNDEVDDDGNGWVDDISGWDLLYADNNPLDTVDYGHGTGEAEDSTAAENGTGGVGTCPRCRFLPVRVSDSFIADGGRFAAGVLFALDSGADVVQEALGALNNPPQARAAIDAAYRRGWWWSRRWRTKRRSTRTCRRRSSTRWPSTPSPRRSRCSAGLSRATWRSTAARTSVAGHSSRCRRAPAPRRLRVSPREWSGSWSRSREMRASPAIRTSTVEATASRRTRRCRSCAGRRTTSTSPLRTPSIRRTTSAPRPGALRHGAVPDYARVGRRARIRAHQRVRDRPGRT
ncbi:MAG: S8 family serine peptidase [Acidimicrobiia bacterium]|nr:S8 family serine peptidase [Acidimicrobiia bacterium]